jgi:hypothetical protein
LKKNKALLPSNAFNDFIIYPKTTYMKKIIASLLLIAIVAGAHGQSKSYRILREKFQGNPNVFSFSTSGFLARTALWMAGEHDYTEAVKDVQKVRLTVVPESAFKANRVTLGGFKKIAKKDGFEELARVKDHGDDVTLLLQSPSGKKANRYLLLVDSNSEIVIIEITGYVDPSILLKDNAKIASE